jgi:hypothetical protein
MTNFDFLKQVDSRLFEIITEAEKLYRDEYFEQCMVQTRKFGENICKNVMGTRCTVETTFDEMLATLKDKVSRVQEKEFIDDLYFLKKQGNDSAHSTGVKKEGMLALECLQRAFEVSLNYAVYYANATSNLLSRQYDIDLLITGKKSKKTLTEIYVEGKKKNIKAKQSANKSKQAYSMKSNSKSNSINLFKYLLMISIIISMILVSFLYFVQ